MGTSKAIGPGRRTAASLSPGSPGRTGSGLTRSDGAGTGSRARPESDAISPMSQDRKGPIPSSYMQKPTARQHCETTRDLPCRPDSERPGEDPRAVRVTRLLGESEVHVAATAGHGGGLVLLPPLPDHRLGGAAQPPGPVRVAAPPPAG